MRPKVHEQTLCHTRYRPTGIAIIILGQVSSIRTTCTASSAGLKVVGILLVQREG
jgi:hypothetical protein